MVDLSNLPEDQSGTQSDLMLYRFIQFYEPDCDIKIPLLTGRKKQKATEEMPAENETFSTSKTSPINKLPTFSA